MEIIEKKRVSDSVIITKAKLLQFTNNVSNIVSLLGVSTIILPIPEKAKYIVYLFIVSCLIYSSLNGNDTASKIIEARKNKGDIFTRLPNDETLVKLNSSELSEVKNTLGQ
jgi:hypothetical protein